MDEGWSQEGFWTAVAQLTPVLAIALTLEARAIAAQWTLEDRTRRAWEGAILLALGAVLFVTFSASMAALARGTNVEEWAVRLALWGLIAAFFGISYNALVLTVSRGTSDIAAMFVWLLPFSKAMRGYRQARRSLRDARSKTDRAIEKAAALLARQREHMSLRGLLTSRERQELSAIEDAITQDPDPEGNELVEADRLVSALAKYESSPSKTRARRVRKASLRVHTRLLAISRLQNIELLRIEQELDHIAANWKGRGYSAEDRERFEEAISAATQPGLLPWSTRPREETTA